MPTNKEVAEMIQSVKNKTHQYFEIQKENQKLRHRIGQEGVLAQRKVIAKILAYVEKNYDEPELEEYLWRLLDNETEFE